MDRSTNLGGKPPRFLFLAGVIALSGGTFTSEREIIRSLQGSEYVCVVLWLPGVEGTRTSPWTNLPFPVQVWTTFGKDQLQVLKNYHALSRKVVVVVPSSEKAQRNAIHRRLQKDAIFVPLVRVVYVLRSEEPAAGNVSPEVTCLLVFANETTIDAPEDAYRKCSKRVAVQADTMFQPKPRTGWASIRGTSVIGVAQYIDKRTGGSYDYNHTSHGITLIRAYQNLNVSVIPFISDTPYAGREQGMHQVTLDVLHKKIDVSLFPVPCNELYRVPTDVDAVTSVGRMVFYTAKSKRRAPALPLHFVTLLAFGCVAMLLVAILVVYFLQGRVMNFPADICTMALFLYSVLVMGATNEPPSSERVVTKILVTFWSIGVIFLSMYIQSDLTSEVCIPTASQTIDTIDVLERFVKLRKIRPCVLRNLMVHRYVASSESGALRTLKDALNGCDDCLQNFGNFTCTDNVERGTHTFVLIESKYNIDRVEIPRWHRGSEFFAVIPGAFMASKAFPFLREHRQIARTLLETGLYLPGQKQNSTSPEETVSHKLQISAFNFLFFYICGSLASTVAFLIECSSRKRTLRFSRVHRRRGRRGILV